LVRHRVRRVLARVGLISVEPPQIAPLEPELSAPPPPFYDVSPTCQIPFLGFLFELVFGERHEGVFVEVGAYDGYSYSNTSCLAEAGWNGWYIEPVPTYAERCRQRYASNPRIHVAEVAIGGEEGDLTVHLGEYLSTPSKSQLEEYRETSWAKEMFTDGAAIQVPMTTLDHFLEANDVQPEFDLLVVDVEGFETAVFSAFDVDRWRPRAMIVELKDTDPESAVNRADHTLLSRKIAARGYEIIFKDRTNTFFVRSDQWLKA
jgi:FkbM family methyltransferase